MIILEINQRENFLPNTFFSCGLKNLRSTFRRNPILHIAISFHQVRLDCFRSILTFPNQSCLSSKQFTKTSKPFTNPTSPSIFSALIPIQIPSRLLNWGFVSRYLFPHFQHASVLCHRSNIKLGTSLKYNRCEEFSRVS